MEARKPPPPPAPAEQIDVERSGEPQKSGRHSFWREFPILLIIAFGVALVIKTFLAQAFFIPSESMEPTLGRGDRVLVEKVGYRFGGPGRGDVVVFERSVVDPLSEEDDYLWADITDGIRSLFGFPTGGSQDFIKRVIAVGGDTVEGRDGRVFVNGNPVSERYLAGEGRTSSFGPVRIPEGSIFVMGDNRANSDDSRGFGPVPVGSVVGHAFLLIWPPRDFGTL